MTPKLWGRIVGQHVLNKLKDAFLRNAAPGTYYDGGGLMVKISSRPAGGRSTGRWLLRIMVHGHRREFGLGGYPEVGLAAARAAAQALRDRVAMGDDPMAERQAVRAVPTFETAARALYDERRAGWKNGKHADQWINTLEAHAFPKIGRLKIADVGPGDIRAVLLPIWTDTPESARRVKQRLGMVIDFALSKGWRTEPNPCDAVVKGLPPQKGERGHFAALPHAEMPQFLEAVRGCTSGPLVKLAFEFLVLTAVRSGEVRGGTWAEIIDLDGAAPVWSIPPERMKAGRAHRVPLSGAAVAVLRQARNLSPTSDLIFPAGRSGGVMSDMTLTKLIRTLGWPKPVTAHGCRSSFRDWAAETTDTPHDVVEAALAHAMKDKTVAAYLRTDHLERRAILMQRWADYLLPAAPA